MLAADRGPVGPAEGDRQHEVGATPSNNHAVLRVRERAPDEPRCDIPQERVVVIVSGVLAARGTLLFLERIPINAIPAELASFFLPAGFGFAPRLGLFARVALADHRRRIAAAIAATAMGVPSGARDPGIRALWGWQHCTSIRRRTRREKWPDPGTWPTVPLAATLGCQTLCREDECRQ